MGAVSDGLIVDCVKRLGSTASAITHDLASAVRIGDRPSRWLYSALVVLAFVAVLLVGLGHPGARFALAAVALTVVPLERVRHATGPDLIPVLRDTGRAELVLGLLLLVVFALHF